jgi:hypothetical protein
VFVTKTFFLKYAQNQCTLSHFTQHHRNIFPKNLIPGRHVLELGSSVPEADAMTTSPRRQG